MSVWLKYQFITCLGISVALLLSACNESKVSQCQRLIKAFNEGTSVVESKKGLQVTTSLNMAKDIQKASEKVKGINLEDEKLQGFQDKFVTIFDNLSNNVTQAAKALGATKQAEASQSGREKIRKARKDIEKSMNSAASGAGKQLDALALEMKEYCEKVE
ncbi:MAG: hypothetical protein AAF378_21320 [Cyanobacteria bacterium P01_A01_bin.84]